MDRRTILLSWPRFDHRGTVAHRLNLFTCDQSGDEARMTRSIAYVIGCHSSDRAVQHSHSHHSHSHSSSLTNKFRTQPRTFALFSKMNQDTAAPSLVPSVTTELGEETSDTNAGFSQTNYNLIKREELRERDAGYTARKESKFNSTRLLRSSQKSIGSKHNQVVPRQRSRKGFRTKHVPPWFPKMSQTGKIQIELSSTRTDTPHTLIPQVNSEPEHRVKANRANRITATVPAFTNEFATAPEEPSSSEITRSEQRGTPSYRENYDRPSKLLVSGRMFNLVPRRVSKSQAIYRDANRGPIKFNLSETSVSEIVTGSALLKEPLSTKMPIESGKHRKKVTVSGQNQCRNRFKTCFPNKFHTSVIPLISAGKLSNTETFLKKNLNPTDDLFATPNGRKGRLFNGGSKITIGDLDVDMLENSKNQKKNSFHTNKLATFKADSIATLKRLPKKNWKAISFNQPKTYYDNAAKSISSKVLDRHGEKSEHKSFGKHKKHEGSTSELNVGSESLKRERDGNNLPTSRDISSQQDARQLPLLTTSNLRPQPSEIQYPWSGPANYPYRRYSQFPSYPLQQYDLAGYDNRYNFGYGVADNYQGTYFGQVENRQQGVTQGQYYVDLPDGRRMIVTYLADGTGYYPTITYQRTPTLIVRGTAQEIPNYNPLGTNSQPPLQYPSYPNINHVHNLGPGHGLVTDEHFLDNHGIHFTPAGPDHIHDQDGPVFGFDRRPISIPSTGSSQPSNVGTSLQPNFIGNTLQPNFIGNTLQPNFISNTLQPNFIGNTLQPNFIGNTLQPNFIGNALQPNFDGSFYPSQPFFPYQSQYPNTLYTYPAFWITPTAQFYPNFSPSVAVNQPSFASSHPPSAPNFGVGIPSSVNNPQGQNRFRPGTGNSFGFSTRNSLTRKASSNTIEEHLERQRIGSDSSRSDNLSNANVDTEDEKILDLTVGTDYVTHE
ncbi:Insect cuticle protein [Trinorchestia longiramus]|nr:Insect cuticle protein [Trinorchestia longiramus]